MLVSNLAVKTPLGIKLLSIAFGIWPISSLGVLLYTLWMDYRAGRFASEDLNPLLIEILFCLVLIFMLSLVAVGLWKLEEGARKVALISCSILFALGLWSLVDVVSHDYVGGSGADIIWLGGLTVGSAISVWYLHRGRIKAAFNRIEGLGLSAN